MEEPKQKPDRADEIDLAQLFRSVGRGFSKLGTSIIAGVAGARNQLYQYRAFFATVIVIGLVLGTLYSKFLQKDFYRSSMVLSCDYLNTESLRSQIHKFNLLAAERDREGLQEVFGIDAATAKNVQQFDFRPLVSEDDLVSTALLRQQLNGILQERKMDLLEKEELVDKVVNRLEINKSVFEIGVLVYDPDVIEPLEKAIVNYFKNDPYIKARIEINRVALARREAKLEAELRNLDSLKKVMVKNYRSLPVQDRGTTNVVIGAEGVMTDPLSVVRADLRLYDELEQIREKLALSSDFEIVQGFTAFKKPESASLADVLAASLLISIIVAYLLLAAYRFDRILAEYPKNRQRAGRT